MRCKERVQDNILVQRFDAKLETLQEEKTHQESETDYQVPFNTENKLKMINEIIGSEPAGLSWPVVQRLQGLIRIEMKLLQNGKYNKLATVQAIMQAYRSGKLEWNPRLVTYLWATNKGQLCQPRPLNWAEFREVQKLHLDETNFWIEGVT